MSRFEISPGPWRAQAGVVRSANGTHVADVLDSGATAEQAVANAELMAASPELRDALQQAREWIMEATGRCSLPFTNTVAQIDNALEKAGVR